MKNIKLRIVYLILCSALLLFALFMLAVNLIIPAHFVREAKKALISEAQYQNRTIPYTDDESFFDDEWNDTEEHFLTPSIVFLELDNANQSSGWNRDAYRLEKKLLEYCKGRDLSLNQCYTFKTDRHHLIFMSVQEEQDDWEKPYAYIMYIDIGPITRYIVTLNWAFFAVLLAISSVMCLLGFRFGRDIEKEAERQQTFFQNASHELKTPIALIQGYAEGLTAGVADDPEDRKFYCDTIADEAGHMNRLVMQLLSLSKLELGAEQTFFEEIDLYEMCHDAVQKTAVLCESKGLSVDCENTHVTVRTDSGLLDQVLMNYLSNAIRYTTEGGKIVISASRDEKNARLTVFNEGEGLPEEELPKIWEKFYRTDRARTREAGGTGIGLSLVRAIADTLHGDCGAENVPGGIAFWFTLPNELSQN